MVGPAFSLSTVYSKSENALNQQSSAVTLIPVLHKLFTSSLLKVYPGLALIVFTYEHAVERSKSRMQINQQVMPAVPALEKIYHGPVFRP